MTILLGRTSTGLVVPVLVTADGELVIEGSSVMAHSLLDGSVHSDTIANSPTEGGVIVGIDQGAGVIKWDLLAAGTDGQVLTVQADGSLAWETPSGGGDFVKLYDSVLGASAASIDIQNIPSTYIDLRLRFSGRTDVVANADVAHVRVNNDSGANYYSFRPLIQHSGVLSTSEQLGTTTGHLFVVTGSTAPANSFGMSIGEIIDYTNTSIHKIIRAFGFNHSALTTANQIQRDASMIWKSTAAINRLTILPVTGPNFVAGTRTTLWGLK